MKFSFSTIFLIIEFLSLSTCVSRKKNIANLYSNRVFYKDSEHEESNRFEDKLDFYKLKIKYDGFNRGSLVLTPINYISERLIPYPLIKQKYQQTHFNDLNTINNEIFDSRNSINHDYYRRKRRIIKDYDTINNNNDNRIEIITTPKPNNPVKKTINDVKPYEVYDLESDANEIDFNQIFKLTPLNNKVAKKGHGYLTFGKRYTIYVSPNLLKQESSKANENNLVETEDNVEDVDDDDLLHS